MKNENRAKQKVSTKRNYQSPKLTVIDLAAEEVLVSNCKTQGGPGPVKSCDSMGANPCYQLGS